jgi:hypothetical protein
MCNEIPAGLTSDSTSLGRRSLPAADQSAAIAGPAFRRMRKARDMKAHADAKKRHTFSHDLSGSLA